MEQELNIIEIKKNQNRKVTIFAVILSIISIGLLVAGFLLVSSNKVVMLQSISNLTKKFENFLDDKDFAEKIAASKETGVKLDMGLTSQQLGINGGIVFDYLENADDKKSKLDLNITMDGQNLISGNAVLANNNAYVYVDGITPNYYHTALEYVSILSNLELNSYDKISNLLKDTVKDYIKEDDIKKEKVEITYNGKAKKVNKLSYAITNKAIAEIATNFVNSAKKDQAMLNELADLFDINSDEIVTALDSFISELTYDKVEVGCYYNVYYYGFNKIVKYELAYANNKPFLEYQVDDKETINLYDEEEESVFSLEVTNKNDQFTFTGLLKGEDEEIPFVGNLKDDTLTIVVTQDGVDIILTITSTEEVKDNSYISKNKIILSGSSEGTKITLGTLDINVEYYFGQKVVADVSNSVDVNLMTEQDLTTIETNLMNHPLYQTLMGISGI